MKPLFAILALAIVVGAAGIPGHAIGPQNTIAPPGMMAAFECALATQ